jgi:hypothetical protein
MSLAPDCGIAVEHRVPKAGKQRPTLIPPALSPKIVTLFGSPPNLKCFPHPFERGD